jgi:ribose transport system ATP-binding protein
MGAVERASSAPVAAAFKGQRRIDVQGERAGTSKMRIEAGEVVGLAGLAGHGQKEILQRIYKASRSRGDSGCIVVGSAAYVSGDRQREGIFPLWSIAWNITIASIRRLSRAGFLASAAESDLAESWRQRIGIRSASTAPSILVLSGGNRQKVLVARAFATEAEIILFDDPTRGVDLGTKRELYDQIRAAAATGRCFVWYTTETDELFLCDRVYVFHEQKVVDDMAGPISPRSACCAPPSWKPDHGRQSGAEGLGGPAVRLGAHRLGLGPGHRLLAPPERRQL